MSDLVDELAAHFHKAIFSRETHSLVCRAADRIEELVADLSHWVRQAEDNSGGWQRACLRIAHLEAALRASRLVLIERGLDPKSRIVGVIDTALAPEQEK